LSMSVQIADALDKAHRAGIVHRDLKPGNVMLVRRGGPSRLRDASAGQAGLPDVKLLDFGLAKVTPSVAAASGLSIAPTGLTPMTMQGTILGTLQYMAPEQIEGQEADARTDIFAFGAMLYEMVAGRKAFDGRSQASLIGAILKDQPPPLGASQALALPFLDRVVRKCLAKDPNERWQSAADLRDELRWIGDARVEGATVPAHGRTAGARKWFLAGVAVVAIAVGIALAATAALRFGSAPREVPETRLQIITAPTTDPISMAISPDGRRLVYVATDGGISRLWIRPLDTLTSQPLAGTENALYPFWSPDSRSIAFFAGNKLMRVDIGGGLPQAVANAPAPRGGAWNNDGMILYAPINAGGLLRVPALGGSAVAATPLMAGQTSQRFPQFLPDGRHFLYFAQGTAEAAGVYLASLDAPEGKRLTAADTAAAYLPTNELLYVRQGTLIVQHFDTARAILDGDPATLADPVGFDAGFSIGAFSVSATGMVRSYGPSRGDPLRPGREQRLVPGVVAGRAASRSHSNRSGQQRHLDI
jgi:eukaryotic-like serine/threonine-protein kinase